MTNPVFPASITVNGTSRTGASVTVLTFFDPRTGVYNAVKTEVEDPIAPLRGKTLRSTPLREIMREQLRAALRTENPDLSRQTPLRAFFYGRQVAPASPATALSPQEKQLEAAALVHRFATAVGDFPTRAIARAFGLDVLAARRWTGQLRRKGLIS